MPTLSRFYGISIQMYFREHGVPHFHAIYGDRRASIAVETLEVLEGSVPPRVLGLVREWATLHQAELLADWELCRRLQAPAPIAPLE